MKTFSTRFLSLLAMVCMTAIETFAQLPWTEIATIEGGQINNYISLNSGSVLVQTPAGLFITANEGEQWNAITVPNVAQDFVGLFRTLSGAKERLWVRVRGIDNPLYSDDEGKTWSEYSLPLSVLAGTRIRYLATQVGTMVVMLQYFDSTTIHSSANHGADFTKEFAFKGTYNYPLFESSTGELYFFKSGDSKKRSGSGSWSPINLSVTNLPSALIGSGNNLLVMAGNKPMRSLDGGMTWDSVVTGLKRPQFGGFGGFGGFYFLTALSDGSVILSFPSGNNASRIQKLTTGATEWTTLHDSLQPAVTFVSATTNSKWIGIGSGGIAFSNDAGTTWSVKVKGLLATPLGTGGIAPDGTLYVTPMFGGVLRRGSGVPWVNITPQKQFEVNSIRYYNMTFTKSGNLIVPYKYGVLTATDQGSKWFDFDSSSVGKFQNMQFPPVSAGDSRQIIASDSRLFMSNDDGITWDTLSPNLPFSVGGVALRGKGMLLGTTGGIYEVSDEAPDGKVFGAENLNTPFVYSTKKGIVGVGFDVVARQYWVFRKAEGQAPSIVMADFAPEADASIFNCAVTPEGTVFLPTYPAMSVLKWEDQSFTHSDLPNEIVTFVGLYNEKTLVATTYSGRVFSVSAPVGVEDESSTQFTVSPSPAIDNLSITSNVPFRSVEVVSLDGRTLFGENSIEEKTSSTLSTSALTSGMYVIRLATERGYQFERFTVIR